jgi:hypothetical protein
VSVTVGCPSQRARLQIRSLRAEKCAFADKSVKVKCVIKGPKGPEPAVVRHWAFSKKNPGLSKTSGLPRRHVEMSSNKAKQQKFSPNEPGGRANVFFVLRCYYYYVNVTFSCTLRHGYRSGRNVFVYVTFRSGREDTCKRIAARVEGPWRHTSQCRVPY